MDISAALTPQEVALLSDPELRFEQAAQGLQAASGYQQGRDESSFEHSLRLKVTLDTFEQQAVATPSWATLSVLLNCEYQLYVLNEATPLRHNPFLSHWVETIQRLSIDLPKPSSRPNTPKSKKSSSITHVHISTTRVGLVKALLQAPDHAQLGRFSPRDLYNKHVGKGNVAPFDIDMYIQMLEEEEIYEKVPAASTSKESNEQQSGNADTADLSISKSSSKLDWKQSILTRLESDPESALSDLTRLPLELSSLDFLTNLLQDQTMQHLDIDPSPVIHDFLQHSLRLIEQMGQPVGTNSLEHTSSFSHGLSGRVDNIGEEIDHGREAQTRAVKLLLLFLRNLIRKDLVSLDAIYFEIQEICVRYVWIKEVREFRSFVHLGTSNEQIS